MIGISQSIANDQTCLNRFHVNDDGFLVDQDTVEFSIFDLTGTPTEIVARTPATRFGLGSYFAPFTPDIAANIGLWEIRWFSRETPTSTEIELRQRFNVMVAAIGRCTNTYVNVQQIRDEGFDSSEISDERAFLLIQQWQDFIERRTRQWFNPRPLTLKLDGRDGSILPLTVPIIGVESLTINRTTTILLQEGYDVYAGVGDSYPDVRRNPRVILRTAASVHQIPDQRSSTEFFSRPVTDEIGSQFLFLRGRRNQVLKGVFGFVEPDFLAPAAIQRALLKLIVSKRHEVGSDEDFQSTLTGRVIEEETDRHRIKYASAISGQRGGTIGITGDPEIEELLALYRSPLALGATGTTMANAV